MDRDGYKDSYQVTQCNVGVSLLSKTHPLFMDHSNGSVMQTSNPGLFPVLFYDPYRSMVPFSFTCVYQYVHVFATYPS